MSTNIVDRRKNPSGKSVPNRQKFLKRIEDQIKKAIPNIVDSNSIDEITKGKGSIKIPVKGISEPEFGYDHNSGDKKYVHPGNKKYSEGDTIKKPQGGQGRGGRQGSRDASVTEDEFTVSISRDEFLDFFFKDLELPDMVRKQLAKIVDFKQKRAGYTTVGNPSRLNIVKSYTKSLTRRLAMESYYDAEIKRIEDKLKDKSLSVEQISKLEEQLENFKRLKIAIPFMDDIDLRYNNFEKFPVPTTQAVMFCIMDVSGSMGQNEKDIAKRFFLLLYMFLMKEYEKIEIVYIRHHTEAKEVSEQEFFDSRESGGTEVLPALELMNKIINEKYNGGWNIYASQISDGDVWGKQDADDCAKFLESEILNKIQYMIYVEVCREGMGDLWMTYAGVKNRKNNFEMGKINKVNQIWQVFQDFFKKKVTK